MKRDLKSVGMRDGEWYDDDQSRRSREEVWSHRLAEHQQVQAVGLRSGEKNKNMVCRAREMFQEEEIQDTSQVH